MIPKALSDTFPEAWPDALAALAPAATQINLGRADTWSIGVYSPVFRNITGATLGGGLSHGLATKIDTAMAAYPEGVSPRIGFCSWKDTIGSDAPVFGTRGVLAALMSGSDRVGRALAAHLAASKPAVLHLRAWRDIPRHAAFRVFLHAGDVIGASQYHSSETFSQLLDAPETVIAPLNAVMTKVADAVHLENCIVDLCITEQSSFLIELNPFIRQTDPCLFSWRDPDGFDGRLRLRSGNGFESFSLTALSKTKAMPASTIAQPDAALIQ